MKNHEPTNKVNFTTDFMGFNMLKFAKKPTNNRRTKYKQGDFMIIIMTEDNAKEAYRDFLKPFLESYASKATKEPLQDIEEPRKDESMQVKSRFDIANEYIKSNIIKTYGVMIPKAYLHRHYKQWCLENGINQVLKERTFFQTIKKELIGLEELRSRNAKDRNYLNVEIPMCILNIAFKDEDNLLNFEDKESRPLRECNISM